MAPAVLPPSKLQINHFFTYIRRNFSLFKVQISYRILEFYLIMNTYSGLLMLLILLLAVRSFHSHILSEKRYCIKGTVPREPAGKRGAVFKEFTC